VVDIERKPILSLVNISKKFPGVQALDRVTLTYSQGKYTLFLERMEQERAH